MSDTCPTAPSSASVCGLFDGEPGAWPKFITHWLLRSVLIMPGFLIVGIKDKRLLIGPLASSTLISAFLMLYTAVERGRRGQPATQRRRRRTAMAGRRHKLLAQRAARVKRQQLLEARHRRVPRRTPSLALMRGFERTS